MASFFEPLQAGAFTLNNRIVLAPLTRCRSSAGRVPNDLMREYYVQRASAGLMLSEATSVSAMGVDIQTRPASGRKSRWQAGSVSPKPCMRPAVLFCCSFGTSDAFRTRIISAALCRLRRVHWLRKVT